MVFDVIFTKIKTIKLSPILFYSVQASQDSSYLIDFLTLRFDSIIKKNKRTFSRFILMEFKSDMSPIQYSLVSARSVSGHDIYN